MATVIGGEMSYLTRAKNISKWAPRRKLHCGSYDDALEHVKAADRRHKGNARTSTRGRASQKRLRSRREVELLRVGHEKFGHRWVLMDDSQIQTGPEAFVAYVEDKFQWAEHLI